MSIVPPLLSKDPPAPADWIAYRLTLDQYHAMGEAGILTRDDRVELIEGYLVEKPVIDRVRILWTIRIRKALAALIGGRAYYVNSEAITFEESEPEPDLMVVRGTEEDYPTSHPTERDTVLLLEVANSSLARDRGWKKELYARAGIPVYWIMNVNDVQLEVYSAPANGEFAVSHTYSKDDAIPVVIDGVEIGTIALAEISK